MVLSNQVLSTRTAGRVKDAAGTSATTAHTVSAWSLLAQLLLGLAIILVIIFLATRLLSGRGRRSTGAGRRRMPVTVLARQSMGKGVSIVIVQAGTATYLLGVTPHQVSRLDLLDPASLAGADEVETVAAPMGSALWDRSGPPWGALVRRLQDRSVRR